MHHIDSDLPRTPKEALKEGWTFSHIIKPRKLVYVNTEGMELHYKPQGKKGYDVTLIQSRTK
jgi:hypothetical protein